MKSVMVFFLFLSLEALSSETDKAEDFVICLLDRGYTATDLHKPWLLSYDKQPFYARQEDQIAALIVLGEDRRNKDNWVFAKKSDFFDITRGRRSTIRVYTGRNPWLNPLINDSSCLVTKNISFIFSIDQLENLPQYGVFEINGRKTEEDLQDLFSTVQELSQEAHLIVEIERPTPVQNDQENSNQSELTNDRPTFFGRICGFAKGIMPRIRPGK